MTEERGEIHPADPATRRRAVLAVFAFALAGVAGGFALQDWLADLRAGDSDAARAALGNALTWGASLTSLAVLCLAAQLWWTGMRVRRAGRYPPPAARLARTARVVIGDEARTRGIALQALAVLLAVLVAGLLLATCRLVDEFAQAGSSSSSSTSAVSSRFC